MAANSYKVPKKQWGKWNDVGRETFNGLYFIMSRNPGLFNHPKAKLKPQDIPRAHWKVTCWNAAWLAADEATIASKAA